MMWKTAIQEELRWNKKRINSGFSFFVRNVAKKTLSAWIRQIKKGKKLNSGALPATI